MRGYQPELSLRFALCHRVDIGVRLRAADLVTREQGCKSVEDARSVEQLTGGVGAAVREREQLHTGAGGALERLAKAGLGLELGERGDDARNCLRVSIHARAWPVSAAALRRAA